MKFFILLIAFTLNTNAATFPDLICVTTPMKIGANIFSITQEAVDFKYSITTLEVVGFNRNGRMLTMEKGTVSGVEARELANERVELDSTVGILQLKPNYAGGLLIQNQMKKRVECSERN